MTLSIDKVFERFNDRWPQTGDRLLSPGRQVFLAAEADERNYRLLRGYKYAGDILIQAAVADRAETANLVFPALFNYRHYIELALKYLIQEYGAPTTVPVENRGHKLTELWQRFIVISESFGHDRHYDAAQAVGACIAELDAIDLSSTVFRYARDLKGDTPSLPNQGLNLVSLHDVMNGIESFFEASDQAMSSALENQHTNRW